MAMLRLCALIRPTIAEEMEPRVDVEIACGAFDRRGRSSHFSLLAQRKVTKRNGLKSSWRCAGYKPEGLRHCDES
jgi:hypothetical protein